MATLVVCWKSNMSSMPANSWKRRKPVFKRNVLNKLANADFIYFVGAYRSAFIGNRGTLFAFRRRCGVVAGRKREQHQRGKDYCKNFFHFNFSFGF